LELIFVTKNQFIDTINHFMLQFVIVINNNQVFIIKNM